jgi:Transposase zinc-binding domain
MRYLAELAWAPDAILHNTLRFGTAACGWEEQAYCSCGNRNCPKCQALAQEK